MFLKKRLWGRLRQKFRAKRQGLIWSLRNQIKLKIKVPISISLKSRSLRMTLTEASSDSILASTPWNKNNWRDTIRGGIPNSHAKSLGLTPSWKINPCIILVAGPTNHLLTSQKGGSRQRNHWSKSWTCIVRSLNSPKNRKRSIQIDFGLKIFQVIEDNKRLTKSIKNLRKIKANSWAVDPALGGAVPVPWSKMRSCSIWKPWMN